METLFNGYHLEIAPGTFPLSTDSMALASFVKLPKQARVLDLGSGCGTLGILLCAKDSGCTVAGIELDETAHQAALVNSRENQLQDRLSSICGDFTDIAKLVSIGSFDVCVSNPPYFTAGFLSKSTPLARHEQTSSLEDLIRNAAWALKYAVVLGCGTFGVCLFNGTFKIIKHFEKDPEGLIDDVMRYGDKNDVK